MAIRIRRANAREVREPVVQFFWDIQAWPLPTQADYFRYWDWRHASLSESEPVVWVAMQGQAVVGHMAVYFRNLRFGNETIRVGVSANYRVDKTCRNTMVGARLAMEPRSLVRDGEIAMLLGYGNANGHSMFVGLGSRDLGAMQLFADVRRWRPILARRLPAAAAIAPLAHVAAGTRKLILRRGFSRTTPGLVARNLSAAEVLSMDRSHWSSPGSLMSDSSPVLLVNRYVNCPYRSHRVFGITEESTRRLQGVVVTEGTTRIKVWECLVNEAVLSEEQAVELVLNGIEEAETAIVPLLPASTLAGNFARAGFIRRSQGGPAPAVRTAHSQYEVEETTWWSAYADPAGPLGSLLADEKRWKVWYAWSHH